MKRFQELEHKTLYLVRHGLATRSHEGYGDRIMTAGLLPEAEGTVMRIAGYLKSVPASYNVSSEIPRCRQTAAIIAEGTGKRFVFDRRLNEFHEEAFTSLQERIVSFLEDLSAVPQENVIICSHSSIITGIKEYLLQGSFAFIEEYDFPKEGTVAIIQEGKYRELDFNDGTAH